MPDLNLLISPKSIAVVGASNNPQKIGNIVIKNLSLTYNGQIFPINPNEKQVENKICYPNLDNLPTKPDLVIIAVPTEIALVTLQNMANLGLKNALVYSAGFKEIGESGVEKERQLIEICQKNQINLIGPNCLGFTNTKEQINATFGKTSLQKGNLSLISQSGAIATAFYDWADERGLGTNYTITIGNKSILNENHFLEFLSQPQPENQPGESDINPIAIYIESVANGKELIKIGRQASLKNPVIVLKPGKTDAAANAMQSHTGSLAGNYHVFSSLVSDAGIIHAETTEEFFDLSLALSWENTPKGNKVTIISNAGGPGVISADAINSSSLELSEITPETKKILSTKLPRSASFHNPIDVLGDALADRFQHSLETLLILENVHAIIVIVTPQIMTEISKTALVIKEASKKYQKPIYCSFFGGQKTHEALTVLNQAKIPNFTYPENAVKTLSKVWQWQDWKTRHTEEHPTNQTTNQSPPSSDIGFFLKKTSSDNNLLSANSTSQIFTTLGLKMPRSAITNNLALAEEFADQIGWPVVIKNVQEGNIHKSDKGGVITNINSFSKLKEAWSSINPQNQRPVQVQEQINTQYELIIGLTRDSNFGDVLNFGLGGKLVNLLNDRNIIELPTNLAKLTQKIEKSSFSKLYSGYRDYPRLSIQELYKSISTLYNLFSQFPQIKELEINPVTVNKDGIWFTDPKIFLN